MSNISSAIPATFHSAATSDETGVVVSKAPNPIDNTSHHMDRLLSDNPKFHLFAGKLTSSWSIQPDTLRYIHRLLTPDMTTLETGCGQTTVVFAISGTKHTCIMPDSDEARRVERYCEELGLEKNITFIIAKSEIALAQNGQVPSQLDFVLIDGAHGFPAPILDWYYTAHKLKIGGILSVDDYKMPSVKFLVDYLQAENDEWELIEFVQNTSFFRKLRDPRDLIDWDYQKINESYLGF